MLVAAVSLQYKRIEQNCHIDAYTTGLVMYYKTISGALITISVAIFNTVSVRARFPIV